MKKNCIEIKKNNDNYVLVFSLNNIVISDELVNYDISELYDGIIIDKIMLNDVTIKLIYKKFLKVLMKFEKKIDINDKEKAINSIKKELFNDNYNFSYFINDDLIHDNCLMNFVSNTKSEVVIKKHEALKLNSVLKKYNLEDKDNIKINYQKYSEFASIKDFINMTDKLSCIIYLIKDSNLCQFDQIMFVYDIVKSNEYAMEDKNESGKISRCLHEVINGNNIVCVGFSNYLNFVLNELGITSNEVLLRYENEHMGHQRSLIALNDTNYDLKCLLFSDPTWDCKKNDDYIKNYNFFMRPNVFFNELNKNESMINPDCIFFKENIKDITSRVKNNKNEVAIVEMEVEKIKKYFDSHYQSNFMSIVTKKPSDCIEDIFEVDDLISNEIPAEVFAQALYKVRRIEYINGITNDLPTVDYIKEAVFKRYKKSIALDMLLNMLFTSKMKNKEPKIKEESILDKVNDIVVNSINELDFIDNVDLDLERIKLIRILKNQSHINDNLYIKQIKKTK